MIDLKKMREDATMKIGDKVVSSISQADIAQHLGITQGQVSKYEAAPETVPSGLMVEWVKFLGHTLATAILFYPIEKSVPSPLDPGSDYKEFFAKKKLLLAYLEAEPAPCPKQIPEEFTPEFIGSKIERIAKIPTLVFAGMFDSGKSRMINELLGRSILPEGYQPETQINHILLHSSMKPKSMTEDVVVLKKGFDLDRRSEHKYVMDHKVTMGGYEVLREYGSHKGGKKEGEAALVFVDAPILKVCNIIDTPGDLHNDDDTSTACKAIDKADIVIIPSGFVSFLSGPEAGYIDNIIRRLPAPDAQDPEFPTLGNLFIVATHVDPNKSDQQLQDALLEGGRRLWNLTGENALAERAENTGRHIDKDTLQARIFSFYAETPKRREKLESELSRILGQVFPGTIDRSMLRLIDELKKETGEYYSKQINYYQQAIENREAAKARLQELKDGDAKFKEGLKEKEQAVFSYINEKKVTMSKFIEEVYENTVNADRVEKLIKDKYGENKKEAQEYITHFVMGELQKQINGKTKEFSEELTVLVENYLSSFDFLSNSEEVGIAAAEIPFNAKGALLGGMAGLAGVGALAAWASTLGNLGAYIIAAKGASLLAALGISLSGGAAAVTSALAAIGGPVTIAAGLLIGAILFGLALFGDSWQRRLAKNVVKKFNEEDVASALKQSTEKFWEQTWEGFEKGCASVRVNYDKHVDDLDAIINDPEYTIKKMEELVNVLTRVRDFLANMPWKKDGGTIIPFLGIKSASTSKASGLDNAKNF